MPRIGQLVHQRFIHFGPLVLEVVSLKTSTPATDRDQPVSRRSEPSSRILLIGEQPNPWKVLPLQDRIGRHRGAELLRLCGLLGATSLLSPE